MTIFKDHKTSIHQLLEVIPEDQLSYLSEHTNVDHYTKVLHGKKMFYLLMYGILENDRLSQRTLEDTFNDPIFKTLFKLDETERVCRSSISERLSRIDPCFFKQAYERVYTRFSTIYSKTEIEKYNLVRVDSTMVSEASGKLLEGLDNKSGKKAVKYCMAVDGLLPRASSVFTAREYASEDNAMPRVVSSLVKRDAGHENIYVMDRGLQSARNMKAFEEENAFFIIRAKENRKHVEIESLIKEGTSLALGELTLIQDSKVYLYTGRPVTSKSGKKHFKQELVKVPFRMITARCKATPEKQFCFITNNFELSAREVSDAYKRRWDIEVFFRFIKQELNASHLVSLNKNGIEVILYMTLIVAMLLMVYKHENKIGYKTAKRRLSMEVRNQIIALIVIQCGGNPDIFFKT